jgi:mono/diheme cytochrome c family protein
MALNARVNKEAPKNAPIQPDEQAYLAGAHEYVEHCAVCHGVPGQPQGPVGAGEFPKPPMLFEGKGVTDDPPGETYWKIKNGIRLTGMPAFNGHLSDTEMWQISLLLANADKIPPSVTAALTEPPENQLPAGHTHTGEEAEQPGQTRAPATKPQPRPHTHAPTS